MYSSLGDLGKTNIVIGDVETARGEETISCIFVSGEEDSFSRQPADLSSPATACSDDAASDDSGCAPSRSRLPLPLLSRNASSTDSSSASSAAHPRTPSTTRTRDAIVSQVANSLSRMNAAMFGKKKDRDKKSSTTSERMGRSGSNGGEFSGRATSPYSPNSSSFFSTSARQDVSARDAGGASTEQVDLSRDAEVDALSSEQLRKDWTLMMVNDKNIKEDKIALILSSTKEDIMRTMLKEHYRQRPVDKAKSLVVNLEAALKEPLPELYTKLKKVRVAVKSEGVQWVKDFAEPQGSSMGGLELFGAVVQHVMNEFESAVVLDAQLVQNTVSILHESFECIKAILNTRYGAALILRRGSKVMKRLIQSLRILTSPALRCCVTDENEINEARTLLLSVIRLMSNLAVMGKAQVDAYGVEVDCFGRERILWDLTDISVDRKEPRFAPIVSCFDAAASEKYADHEFLLRLFNLVNLLIGNWSADEESAVDWQARMRIRSEFMRCGLARHVDALEARIHSEGELRLSYELFIQKKDQDFNELVQRYENIKGEYYTLDGCYELLRTSTVGSPPEQSLLSIFQHLLLIPETPSERGAYLRLIESCVNEIVLHRSGVDPNFDDKQFIFETKISDMIEALENADATRRLQQAVEAKHEAAAKSMQYFQKLKEFQNEAALLRQHLADPKATPLPAATKCDLAAPTGMASLPPVTGGPPPPPLPPVTGGPPGPPPPPPMGKGGPPPPPPPPPSALRSGGGPPPPPPPPPGGPPPPPGIGGGPPPPPPPGGFSLTAASPPLPPYLKKKAKIQPNVPMKKLNFAASVIDPKDIEIDSFWAKTNEERFATKKFNEELESRFASKAPAGAVGKAADKKVAEKKKKVALVIQDDKVLQSLGILQGSAKLSHDAWRKALLEMDSSVLPVGILEQLRNAISPLFENPETMKQLAELPASKYDEMLEGEQFVAKLASIKGLAQRLDLTMFMLRLDEIFRDNIKPQVSAVSEACEEIRSSSGLASFIEMVLYSGFNYMGLSGKKQKETHAFKFDVLGKLVETKDVENKYSLLHFLIETMRQGGTENYKFIQKLYHVTPAERVIGDEVQKAVTQLKNNVTKLENALKTYTPQADNDRFLEVMTAFLEVARKTSADAHTMHQKMQADWQELRKYYSFDKKYTMEQFFSDVKKFKDDYEKAMRELDEERAREEAHAKKKTRAAELAAAAAAREPLRQLQTQQTPVSGNGIETLGVLENLEQMMSAGLKKANPSRVLRNSATPRSNAGRAALQRQRSRCAGDIFTNEVFGGERRQTGLLSATGRRQNGGSRGDEPQAEAPLDAPTKFKIRRKGQPTVEVGEMPLNPQAATAHSSVSTQENLRPQLLRRREATPPPEATTDELLSKLQQL